MNLLQIFYEIWELADPDSNKTEMFPDTET